MVAANDDHAPPAEGRSPVVRFANAIGLAMMVLCSLSFGSLLFALSVNEAGAELLFIGAMAASAITLVLTSIVERRLS
jgi:hypothetical protein